MAFPSTNIESVCNTLVGSLASFFEKAGRKGAVLGLSGGIDSAVVAALAVKALGKENVHGILMPSQYSTLHSISDSVDLANNLKIKYHIVPIEKLYYRFIKDTLPFMGSEPLKWDNTQENLQARIRGTILMAYSNRTGALLLNTSNKSEIAVGYGTLYGDLAGALMVLADVYKMQVYELANYLNCDEEVIPPAIILKEPSAELYIGQKDSDSLPEYPILDPILYSMIEEKKSREEILASGVAPELLDRIIQLQASSSFKKHQMPQMIQITDNPLLDKSKCV